ncbi:adenylate kinase [Fusarium globosum]|uniref:Adenylate kinase n=1 Tax=Fusarium globosum TaxID=78864 RepID=A0A8H5XRA4_9HYPO|nr:adenylate kinase [Fusarium globosum]
MKLHAKSGGKSRSFAVVFIIGAPGAGKGTLSAYLAQKYNLVHYSVGDGLRAWVRLNRSTELAAKIQSKLDNQGFLTSEDLNPFIYREILDAIDRHEPEVKGILDTVPLTPGDDGKISLVIKPDLVFSFQITKQNARARYLRRGRDTNDSVDKFERRFTEYELETLPVEQEYRKRGILISIDVNGTKDENIEALTESLSQCEIWQKAIGG